MIIHPTTSVLFVKESDESHLKPFLSYLRSIPHLQLSIRPQLPEEITPYNAIVTVEATAFTENHEHLRNFVMRGGIWLGLVNSSEKALPSLFGVQATPPGPDTELRVLFQDVKHPIASRLPDAFYVKGRYQSFEITAPDTETILYADWHYQHRPVLVSRTVGEGRVASTTLQAFKEPTFQQILYRLLRCPACETSGRQVLGVGILGYSTFVGQEHALGVENTDGLELCAACDVDPERLDQAQKDFPYIKAYGSANALANDPGVELVIVTTPPNTHAELSMKMMAAGKHVLCEKPLAMNQRETAAMVEMSEKKQVHLSCHQNRRWDVDYLTIKQAVDEGRIGELFYMETFVGGFGHPCGYWHSHEEISGGIAFDWGGHYLDWVVGLIPNRVVFVIGTSHKRVWHDVTNADQERVQIRFDGGQEAEFLHSDIAAVRKPKWYILGTEGAIIGHWQDVTTYEVDPVLYYQQHNIPATEMVPELTLHRRHASGQIVAQKLAMPARQPYLLYRNLADHLLTGEPIETPLEQSVLVVAILEAAARSAAHGGTLEVLDG